MVDTGCSTTLIHYDELKKIQPKITGDVRSRIADGRIIKSKKAKVSYFKAGPFKETGFEVNTRYVVGGSKSYAGLLGMNFLNQHPFRIDTRRGVLVWL